MRSSWSQILGSVPRTEPDDDNVVQIAIPLDQIEREIIAANNDLVHLEAEAARIAADYDKALQRYQSAQARLIERLKTLGINAEAAERKGL